jgi:rare lipoprotein A (peptidoglycan hydrolase)
MRRRIAWLTSMLLVLAAAALAPAPASATSVAGQRSQAAQVLHHIEVLDWRRTHLRTVAGAVRTHLQRLHASISNLDAAMASQQRALDANQQALADLIVGDYKNDSTDTAAFVLASASFADLVERVDEVARINASSTDLLHEIDVAQRRLAAERRTLSTQAVAASRESERLSAAEASLSAAIDSRRAVLAGIDAQIAGELAAERQRRATLATQAGSSPTPVTGGSGSFTGEASWYGPGFAGHRTADGEIFDPNKLTAASPWLPFNTMLRVTDLATGRSVVVRINDRGPFGRGVLDLSAHAAQIIGLGGWAEISATVL